MIEQFKYFPNCLRTTHTTQLKFYKKLNSRILQSLKFPDEISSIKF
jgi:hypothetical protein